MMQYESPSAEVLENHYKELGVTPESLRRDVDTIKTWLEKQPHLPNITDDMMLEKFLIHCKNSVERCKGKLDSYYTARTYFTDYFGNRDPLDPAVIASPKSVSNCVLPKTTPQGDRVSIVRLCSIDLKDFDLEKATKISIMLMDAHLPDDKCRKHVVVFDFEGATLGHAAMFTPNVIKRAQSVFLGAMPQRFEAFHVINAPSYFEAIVNLAKQLLGNNKLVHRIFVHSDLSKFHAYIPKEILPSLYGGTYPNTVEEICGMAYESLVEKRDWFLREQEVCADEMKRLNRKPSAFDHQPLEGSFRKILID